eukprot:TRINITY_DN842_c0_g1_i1.p1 TRINITY_DN842_c0_g1~~TRINITY_DN842_c0_g1_i1.p1  ORF type:complete len:324 (-),score=58.26 TRINITY_DN842_c0_g1_i1:262-1233(-)
MLKKGFGTCCKTMVKKAPSTSSSFSCKISSRSFGRISSSTTMKNMNRMNQVKSHNVSSPTTGFSTYIKNSRAFASYVLRLPPQFSKHLSSTLTTLKSTPKIVKVSFLSTLSFLLISLFKNTFVDSTSLQADSKRKLIHYSPSTPSYSFSPTSNSASNPSPQNSPATLTFHPSTSTIKVATSLYSNPIDTLCTRLSTSQSSIQAVVYKFDNDQIYSSLLTLLHRGVRVQLICDMSQNKKQKSLAYKLRSEGAQVEFWDVGGIGKKLHAKFTIVDGEWVMSGSSNWTRNADGDNMELLLEFEGGNNVQEFRNTFDEMWRLARGEI